MRSTFLGAAFIFGYFLSSFDDGLAVFGQYLAILSFFHFSEFMAVAILNPRTLTIDSFILNHSVQYWVAAIASWVEWSLEYYFIPSKFIIYVKYFFYFLFIIYNKLKVY